MAENAPVMIADWIAEYLERVFPAIRWRAPVKIRVLGDDQQHHACRICIARYGLKAAEAGRLPFVYRTEAECRQHVREQHS